ncbi:MAG: SRPBCC family protein [Bacteroidota bacterium]
MKANISKVFQVNQSIDKVWAFLSDPSQVVTCVPGASITEKIDEQNYKGKVSMKFGPVAAKYNGAIVIEELDGENYKMVLKGKGMDAKGQGAADMIMNGVLAEKDGGTEVTYNMDVSITGKLAQFGSRLIVDVTNVVVEQFIGNFKSQLETVEEVAETTTEGGAETTKAAPAPAPAQENSVNAFAIMWAVIKGWFARLFGSKS